MSKAELSPELLKASVWTSIKPDKRRLILDDILDVSRNIGSYYPHTIFNELKRRTIIDLMSDRNGVGEFEKLIDQELLKFSDR